MKKVITLLLLALLVGFTLTSCTNKKRQLDAAVTAINKQFPQQITDGFTLQGFFPDDKGNIDITITIDERKVTTTLNDSNFASIQKEVVGNFGVIARQDKSFYNLFQLVDDNEKTMSLSFVQQPSGKKHSINISRADIKKILSTKNLNEEQIGQQQIDQYIEAQQKLLPVNQGPVTCVGLQRNGTVLTWDYDVDENTIDMERMKENGTLLRENLLKAYMEPDGLALVRLVVAGNCTMLHRYKGNKTGTVYELTITSNELRDIQRSSNSTKIK